MVAPIRLRLDHATRTAVSERYEQTRNAVERTNCQVVLLADEGRHAQQIAWLVRRGPDQVRTVLHRFQAEGLVWVDYIRREPRVGVLIDEDARRHRRVQMTAAAAVVDGPVPRAQGSARWRQLDRLLVACYMSARPDRRTLSLRPPALGTWLSSRQFR